MRGKNVPAGKKENHKIGEERKMLLVPYFEGAFVRKDNSTITLFWRKIAFRHDQFFITKDDGTNTSETGLHIINFCFHFITVPVKAAFHQRPWTGKRHIAGKNIKKLRKLIDL